MTAFLTRTATVTLTKPACPDCSTTRRTTADGHHCPRYNGAWTPWTGVGRMEQVQRDLSAAGRTAVQGMRRNRRG